MRGFGNVRGGRAQMRKQTKTVLNGSGMARRKKRGPSTDPIEVIFCILMVVLFFHFLLNP